MEIDLENSPRKSVQNSPWKIMISGRDVIRSPRTKTSEF